MLDVKGVFRRVLWGYRASSEGYVRWLRKQGMRIGTGTRFYDPRSVFLDETRPWLVEIGQNVQIAHGVNILTHGYEWAVIQGVWGEILGSAGKVTIGDNVFLGMNATVLKGVTIGSNTIVGAGSVVCRDLPGNCVAAGNPARVLMTLEAYREKRKAAQAVEGQALAAEYERVYGKRPGPEELREFFWLFAQSGDALPACWEGMFSLQGKETLSREAFERHQKSFANLDAFLDSLPPREGLEVRP